MEDEKFEKFKRELTSSESEDLAINSFFKDFSLIKEPSRSSNEIKLKMKLVK